MVMSVNPIRCVTLARWLTRGMFNSVGWLPFLNCASAVLTSNPNPANPTNSPKTHFGISRMTVTILSRNCKLVDPPRRLYSWHIGRLPCGKVSLGKREIFNFKPRPHPAKQQQVWIINGHQGRPSMKPTRIITLGLLLIVPGAISSEDQEPAVRTAIRAFYKAFDDGFVAPADYATEDWNHITSASSQLDSGVGCEEYNRTMMNMTRRDTLAGAIAL